MALSLSRKTKEEQGGPPGTGAGATCRGPRDAPASLAPEPALGPPLPPFKVGD